MTKKPLIIILLVLFGEIGAGLLFVFFSHQPAQVSSSNLNRLANSRLSVISEEVNKRLPQIQEGVSLIAVGDLMLSRDVAKKIKTKKDINYPFLLVKDYLKKGDIVFGNLESPITAGREIQTNEMVFRADPGTEKALKEAGFNILSLANNHTPNFGQSGLKDTFRLLKEAGLQYVGAGANADEANAPRYLEAKDLKFAFLAYNDPLLVPKSYEAKDDHHGTAFMDIEKMMEAVKEAEEKADFVIVSMHAGKEYAEMPNQSQINFARAAIDAGADFVIGHHPHVVQKMEQYKGKYIFYSLGNFVFDQMWSEETKEGVIVKVFFNKNGPTRFEAQPVLIEDFSQPRILEGGRAEKILKRLELPSSQ